MTTADRSQQLDALATKANALLQDLRKRALTYSILKANLDHNHWSKFVTDEQWQELLLALADLAPNPQPK